MHDATTKGLRNITYDVVRTKLTCLRYKPTTKVKEQASKWKLNEKVLEQQG